MTRDTLYILITCAKDPIRLRILKQVVENLFSQNVHYPFLEDLIVFDNASTEPGSAELIGKFKNVAHSSENIGYWSAVDWCLREGPAKLGREYKYAYVIESDLLHYKMERIELAKRYLDLTPTAGSVRTQLYSIRFRFHYTKDVWWWPFRSKDAVSGIHLMTREPVRFSPSEVPRVFHSNFHPKVPALHRFATLKENFEYLSTLRTFDEGHFINFYNGRYSQVGVLNGGIYTARIGWDPTGKHVPTGSHQTTVLLQGKTAATDAYQSTRVASVRRGGFTVDFAKKHSTGGQAKV